MKFYVHDNDLHERPLGQEIIARLGWAGYGRAHAMLETLTKLVPNDGQCVFQLPLVKPTDLAFWARKFQQSEEETQQTFAVFEDAGLIAPWQDTQRVYAPMLGERVDEYTKRKNKQVRKQIEPGDPGASELPESKTAQTDGEIVAQYSMAFTDCTGGTLQATAAHRKAAIAFYKKHGKEIAIAAWVAFLNESPSTVKLNGKVEERMWRLNDFLASGDAEQYAEQVRSFAGSG